MHVKIFTTIGIFCHAQTAKSVQGLMDGRKNQTLNSSQKRLAFQRFEAREFQNFAVIVSLMEIVV